MPAYTDSESCNGMCDFHIIFSIMFPMVTGKRPGVDRVGAPLTRSSDPAPQTIFVLVCSPVTFLFPSLGIMEGANLSGDLKDPAKSIPKGLSCYSSFPPPATLSLSPSFPSILTVLLFLAFLTTVFSATILAGTLIAVGVSFTIYMAQIFFMAGAFSRDTLKLDQNIYQNGCINKYLVIVGSTGAMGSAAVSSFSFVLLVSPLPPVLFFLFFLSSSFPSLALASRWPCLACCTRYSGIMISSLSSALGSLFGGSRILQAMARDKLLGVLKPFAYGSRRGDEPRVAVLFTWVVAQVCCRRDGAGRVQSRSQLLFNFPSFSARPA